MLDIEYQSEDEMEPQVFLLVLYHNQHFLKMLSRQILVSFVLRWQNSYLLFNVIQCCGSGSSWIRIYLVGWIQIQEGQKDPQKI
jgi:hypothetical protein